MSYRDGPPRRQDDRPRSPPPYRDSRDQGGQPYYANTDRGLPPRARDERRRSPPPRERDYRNGDRLPPPRPRSRSPPAMHRARDSDRGNVRYEDERDVRRPRYDDRYDDPYRRGYEPGRGGPPGGGGGGGPPLGSDHAAAAAQGHFAPAYHQQPPYPHAGGSHLGPPPPAREQKPMSAPSQSVIFLGLPQICDEQMLQQFLEDFGCAVDSTTIIYDKETGLSRRFGFARFASMEHSRAFVMKNFPIIVWRDRTGRTADEEGTKIKIDFSQTDKHPQMRPPARVAPQIAPMTAASKSESSRTGAGPAAPPNDGVRDIGPLPSEMLLIRGLDPLTRDSDIADAIEGLPGIEDGEVCRQILHVRDRQNRGSLGFAFVTFNDNTVAASVLAKIWDPRTNPQGWKIRGHAVTVTFAHKESFRPAYAASSWSFRTEAGKDLLYWDERAFVSEWSNPRRKALPLAVQIEAALPPDDEADEFLASFGAPEASEADPPKPDPSSADPVPTQVAPPIVVIAEPIVEMPPKEAIPTRQEPIAETPNLSKAAAEDEVSPALTEPEGANDSGFAGKKDKKAPELIISRKAAPNIAKWNSKKSELDGGSQAASQVKANKRKLDQGSGDDGFPYADPVKKTCLLCQRQFQKVEDLTRHNDLSNLHKTNLADEALVKEAEERKKATLAAPAYRDRAAERRQTHNQPDAPMPDAPGSKKSRRGPAPPSGPVQPSVPPSEAAQGITETNIGHKLLAAAGWKAGEALGAANGRVDPVQAKMYTAGAGLGAGAGVDAATQAQDAWNAPSTGREKARGRYHERS